MKYLQNGGKDDWMYGPSKINSENYSGIYNGQNKGSVQIQHFGTTTYPEHNNYQNNSYIYNAQYGDGNNVSESSFYNDQLVNFSSGDAVHTYYKDKNPEEYNYYINRFKALKNSPSKGILGTFLPEVTITANKRKGGSVNYLSHFNISKAKDSEKIDWKEKFRDNPDGPKEIENWPSFSEVMDGVSYIVPGYGTYR